ncbi:Reverse transcriptase domain [Trinorchestia longiramus]|nr:Reverse transcriptase domain [Trinorchestia longiramus]
MNKNSLQQHVNKPTTGNNILDLVITTSEVTDKIGDHQIIDFSLDVQDPNTRTQHKQVLDYKRVDDYTPTYKALINSIVTYAAPIWFPNASPSSIAKFQTIQNATLRIAFGSHKMASASHLHRETGVLLAADHLSLLCSQYLLSSLRPHHPNYLTVTQPSGPRNMKHTLQSGFLPSIAHLLSPNGDCLPSTYRQALNSLHSSAVQQAISAEGPNRVLQLSPPPISEEERSLPRSTRTLLSQLRSGHSRALNSYQARIGSVQDPTCSACSAADQTTSHLFSCPNTPTHLTPLDLWLDPVSTATFLYSVPSLSAYFPPPSPEPPPHPLVSPDDPLGKQQQQQQQQQQTGNPVRRREVEEQLSILNPYKSTEPDGLGPRILNETAEVISESLTNIFNRSLETGIVPDDWKRANVTPIFKKGNKQIPNNYRPISLTFVISKTIERLLKVRITMHLNDQNLINDNQHGFREKRSCLTNLLDFFGEVNRINDRTKGIDLVYLDFQKAFVKVPHERLMAKVEARVIRGN